MARRWCSFISQNDVNENQTTLAKERRDEILTPDTVVAISELSSGTKDRLISGDNRNDSTPISPFRI